MAPECALHHPSIDPTWILGHHPHALGVPYRLVILFFTPTKFKPDSLSVRYAPLNVNFMPPSSSAGSVGACEILLHHCPSFPVPAQARRFSCFCPPFHPLSVMPTQIQNTRIRCKRFVYATIYICVYLDFFFCAAPPLCLALRRGLCSQLNRIVYQHQSSGSSLPPPWTQLDGRAHTIAARQ